MSQTEIQALYEKMSGCTSCKLRAGCTRVLPAAGQTSGPVLLVVGESPDDEEDSEGEPFCGPAGRLLREVMRDTRILNRTNTCLTYTIKCRPKGGKFPTGPSAGICKSLWLDNEIRLLAPKRMLLLGNAPLKHVAGMDKITQSRGIWYTIRGIRTLATYHPNFVRRSDGNGDVQPRMLFERDVMDVAKEVLAFEKEKEKEAGV